VLETPQRLPPKEATAFPVADGSSKLFQASQVRSRRPRVTAFEQTMLFGTKHVTTQILIQKKSGAMPATNMSFMRIP